MWFDRFRASILPFCRRAHLPGPACTPRTVWVRTVRELGVFLMALKTLILVFSLFVPSAKPLDRDTVGAHAHDFFVSSTCGVSSADGRSRRARPVATTSFGLPPCWRNPTRATTKISPRSPPLQRGGQRRAIRPSPFCSRRTALHSQLISRAGASRSAVKPNSVCRALDRARERLLARGLSLPLLGQVVRRESALSLWVVGTG